MIIRIERSITIYGSLGSSERFLYLTGFLLQVLGCYKVLDFCDRVLNGGLVCHYRLCTLISIESSLSLINLCIYLRLVGQGFIVIVVLQGRKSTV